MSAAPTGEHRRVVVINGAGGALGAALSARFASDSGTDLVLSDVSRESLDVTIANLPEPLGAIESKLADVGSFDDVEAVVATAVERFGRVDVLISNAGVLSPNGRIHNLGTDDWERAFRVNVLGAVNGIRAVVPVMRTQGGGSIVLTASVSGLTAWSHAGPYCVTKAGVIQLAKVAAVEYARRRDPGELRVPGHVPVGHPRRASRSGARHDRGAPSARPRRTGRSRGGLRLPRERRGALDHRCGACRRRRLLRALTTTPNSIPSLLHPEAGIGAANTQSSRCGAGGLRPIMGGAGIGRGTG